MAVRIIDRYILRDFGGFYVIALGVTTFVLFLDKLLWIASFVLRYHLSFLELLRFLGYTLPTIGGFALPVAFLIGAILTFNRLSTDNEYIALKAAGVSFYRLIMPLGVVACGLYVVTSASLMYGAPWGFQGVRGLVFEVARTRVHTYLRPGEFNDAFAGLVVYVEQTHATLPQLEGIFLADTRATPPHVITARQGELLSRADSLQVVLRLHDGELHRYTQTETRYHVLRFAQYDVRLDLDTHLARRARKEVEPHEMFPSELRQEIANRQAAGKPYRQLVFFQHTLFALPFACIIFAGLGPVLGVVETRSGRSGGYVFGLLAVFFYYIFLTGGKVLGEQTTFPVFLAAWLPNLCLGGITALLMRRTARGLMRFETYWRLGWRPRVRRRPRPSIEPSAS
jgi:lipopolysaccharide export system permease protein